MKRCPTCNKTFSDPNLTFCIDDGTPLIAVEASQDETTIVSPSSRERVEHPVPPEVYKPRDWQTLDYRPPDFAGPTQGVRKSKTWIWVVGILAIVGLGLIGFGIAAAILIPNMMRTAANRNRNDTTTERSSEYNTNRNSNSPGLNPNTNDENDNENTVTDEITTPPPTDEQQVLTALTDLEHEWTVANINADKQKLERILADDYVGMSSDGTNQGKADYINSIKPDTAIQNWTFEDLKLDLRGTRASLSGVIRLQLPDQGAAYKFTDKFVWRDGRWQAVGSEVSRIE